ncbi:hypothetical protein D9M73_156430 [compost metagenome]
MRIAKAIERCSDFTVEVPECAQVGELAQALQCRQLFMLALVVEVPLLELNIRQHLAHEMRLIHLGEPLADTVGTVVQAKGYRNCSRCLQLAGDAALTQVLQQYIATQRITHCIQRRQRALGAKMADNFRQVFAGAGMVAARQQVGLA